MIKVRFAPSPTGEMHIGNLRTAIINWIFARKFQGKLYLRIEDTDGERSKDEYVEKLLKVLKTMKIDYDEFDNNKGTEKGIMYQSKRLEIYRKKAQEIYNQGMAFYCECEKDSEEICLCKNKNLEKGVLRFRVPDRVLSFEDRIFGKLEIESKTLENFALLRSDGSPTYMLAVVVDDIEMEITHIIRGEDHKTNTFKQILIYEALNSKIPEFAHLPIIIGEDNKKLSKRNGNVNVQYYLNQGFVPDSLFNFLLRLGWGYKNEEIISKERIKEIFDFRDVKRSPAKFDEKKCLSFSKTYLKNKEYCEELKQYIEEFKNLTLTPRENRFIEEIYEEVSKRSSTFSEFYEHIDFIFKNKKFLEDKNFIMLDFLKNPADPADKQYYGILEELFSTSTNFFYRLKELCPKYEVDFKEISGYLRQKITGKEFSPDIFIIIELLEKIRYF